MPATSLHSWPVYCLCVYTAEYICSECVCVCVCLFSFSFRHLSHTIPHLPQDMGPDPAFVDAATGQSSLSLSLSRSHRISLIIFLSPPNCPCHCLFNGFVLAAITYLAVLVVNPSLNWRYCWEFDLILSKRVNLMLLSTLHSLKHLGLSYAILLCPSLFDTNQCIILFCD